MSLNAVTDSLALRWIKRYKTFFLLGVLILALQVFLAYKSLGINNTNGNGLAGIKSTLLDNIASANQKAAAAEDVQAAVTNDRTTPKSTKLQQQKQQLHQQQQQQHIKAEQLGFQPDCEIAGKEAISALQRARTKKCRQEIARIACAIQAGQFYAKHLPSHCPAGNHTTNASLGCYHDEKEFRLLSGYFINLKTTNTPMRCTQLCLQSGYPYAGVQYGSECFCGIDAPPSSAKLPDSSCNMKCAGDAKDVCGGYYSMNVYETGISKFTARVAETSPKSNVEQVKIAFLLTLNGRALRQVHRLIKALYSPNHVYYIHVDARQDYLYRELLQLEQKFPNIRLSRQRFSTIWGGASLLTMLLHCMEDLLNANEWHWDFVINLSESDFPVKTVDKLVHFLTANKDRNFVKSHGRETQRFIQKQGLDKTFVECDTHMWRIGDRRLPDGIQIDGGSDWVALSRTFVEHVITRKDKDELLQGLLVIFRHTLLPAESFFHTVLRNSVFCDSYVDNNLHVTNWKRKLGCKCQYKHVVDWCGCSPNDFKPEDWSRLQSTEKKMLYFARKFEPIINQRIILQLEEWLFGPYTSEYANLAGYWQSMYNTADAYAGPSDDLATTFGESLMRLVTRKMQLVEAQQLLELTHYLHQDDYKGVVVRFKAKRQRRQTASANQTETIELEARIRPVQYVKLAKNSKFAKRLRNFEVSSDFDQKEQVSRNLAKLLGPYSEPVLSFTFAGAAHSGANAVAADSAHSYNLTLLWIDGNGQLQDFSELHIEDAQTDGVNFAKALLKQPLTPGIWTVKLIGRTAIYAQTKFLVMPLAVHQRQALTAERARVVNGGMEQALPDDFELPSEWQQHLASATDVRAMQQLAHINAANTGAKLQAWIDELVSKFYHIRDICAVSETATNIATHALEALPLCRDTTWSTLAPDPKSDVNQLLKHI